MTSVVIVDVGGDPATRPVAQGLAHRLRRVGLVVAIRDPAGGGAESTTAVSSVVRRLLDSGSDRPLLVLFGDEIRQRRVVWSVALSGLLPRVRLVVHAGAARIPYDPMLAEVFARAHVVVTESKFGARAVRRCCAEAGDKAPPVVVTSPAFPPRSSLPASAPSDRRALRRARMDIGDDGLVIGCWIRDGLDPVAPLAIHIFHLFTRGHYWRCDRCGHLTPWSVDDHLRPVPYDTCERCRSGTGAVGRARDDARLLLVGQPADDNGVWGTRAIGARLGLDDLIVYEPETMAPAGRVPRLWGCVDVHLQPHLLADVPAPMRASWVVGVPMVATRYGAVEEHLTGAARLVPPRMVVDHSAGHRMALMDPGAALAELCRLADDHAARRMTEAGLHELRQEREAGGLLDRWVGLLDVPMAT